WLDLGGATIDATGAAPTGSTLLRRDYRCRQSGSWVNGRSCGRGGIGIREIQVNAGYDNVGVAAKESVGRAVGRAWLFEAAYQFCVVGENNAVGSGCSRS